MKQDQPKRKHRWVLVLVLLLIGFGVYGGYRLIRTDPNVKKAREIRKELTDANLPPEQRREKFQQLRDTMDKMTPQQRERMQREMADERRNRSEAEMQRYAKMTREEKDRYLDRRIDRAEAMRQRMQQGGSGAGNGANGQGGSFVSSGGANGSGFQGGGQGQGNRGNSSANDREKRRKQFLDDTTPEFRAMRDQYFQEMRDRRQQRGYSAGAGFGR